MHLLILHINCAFGVEWAIAFVVCLKFFTWFEVIKQASYIQRDLVHACPPLSLAVHLLLLVSYSLIVGFCNCLCLTPLFCHVPHAVCERGVHSAVLGLFHWTVHSSLLQVLEGPSPPSSCCTELPPVAVYSARLLLPHTWIVSDLMPLHTVLSGCAPYEPFLLVRCCWGKGQMHLMFCWVPLDPSPWGCTILHFVSSIQKEVFIFPELYQQCQLLGVSPILKQEIAF